MAKTTNSKKEYPFRDFMTLTILTDDNGVANVGVKLPVLNGSEALLVEFPDGNTYEVKKTIDHERGTESMFHDDVVVFGGCIEEKGETKTGKKRFEARIQIAKSTKKSA
jgi:hypothetical protein|tara:strand:- start:20 stop:346 length:327 start_codon:yes stop_codon:yes gene_type:complete